MHREPTSQEYIKLLSQEEMLAYVFKNILPDDFPARFAALIAKSPEVRRAQQELRARKLGTAVPQMTQSQAAWRRVALVLPIHIGTCLSCGTAFEAPYGRPLVKEIHPRFGTHLFHPEGEFDTSELPREIQLHQEDVRACGRCFSKIQAIPREMGQLEICYFWSEDRHLPIGAAS